jgi:hypothetical protein
MRGLVRKSDSDGKTSYFIIVGINMDDCEHQVSELCDHARHCDTGNKFYLVATRQYDEWRDIEGRTLSDEYVLTFLRP